MSFGRLIAVTIQSESQEELTIQGVPFPIAGRDTSSQTAVSGLRIRFNALKTAQAEANEVEIEIFNLSEVTFDRIQAIDNFVILKAGYVDEGGLKMVATGNITKSVFTRQGTETRAILTCLDGQKDARAVPLSLSYAPSTQVSTIVTDILSQINMSLGKQSTIPNVEYISGYSFVGKGFDALSEVLSRVGLSYTIQNNEIYILEAGETIESTATLISPETGLLESPIPKASVNGAGATAIESKLYIVKSLLNPVLLPGSLISLKSKNTTGFFKIQTIRQKGDNWQGAFESDMEVIQI